MKRWIAMAAVAVALPAIAAAAPASAKSAQAAPKTPSAALKAFVVPGNGVKITDRLNTSVNAGGYKAGFSTTANGTLAFGAGKVNSHDLKRRWTLSPVFKQALTAEFKKEFKTDAAQIEKLLKPSRTVAVGTSLYYSGAYYADKLPEGKKWVHTKLPAPLPVTNGSLVNVFNLKTYNAVQAVATKKSPGGTLDGVKTTLLQGSITLGKLRQVSDIKQAFPQLTPAQAKIPVTIKIWIGADQLPRRVTTTIAQKQGKGDTAVTTTLSQTTNLTGWAKGVKVTAPPADQVVELADLDTEGLGNLKPWDMSTNSIG
ncbi:hypothetical protein [Sinosporangium siamense]|uniref:Uncharacterized protein n=1 Tax=Sinosporangium siamense TaxID=1367973 RepID=A0A919V4U8_9ACTN|nr:hypothetical protein [Sinosporangium siamense]GII90873.1 hypothetical protein Ssi02_11040 [Sinosporangium siamense]